MNLKLVFEIELRSDYHISAGHGLGPLIDSALQRDSDGAPVLRGASLVGLLRDGLYRLLELGPLQAHRGECRPPTEASGRARFCGQYAPDLEKTCPICRIFGSPRLVKHWRFESARPVGLPQPLEDWPYQQAGGQVVPHVRVSPRTRRAEAGKLFFEEEGDARLRFQFNVIAEVGLEQALNEAEWLIAAARYVRHLGAGRRRGRGECHIRLVRVEDSGNVHPPEGQSWEQWLLARFEAHCLGQEGDPCAPATGAASFARSPAGDAQAVRLLVTARLDEPLIISGKAEAGNEFHSLEYIPGPALRGALAGLASARYRLDPAGDEAAYEAFVQLFFRDAVRFSHLYPAQHTPGQHDIYPAIPAPRDLFSCELYPGFAASETSLEHGVIGLTFEQGHDTDTDIDMDCQRCKPHTVSMKPQGEGFFSLRCPPKRLEREDMKHVTEMHVHIDPSTQRATSGDLFGFDMLAAGRYFVGEMRCANEAAWQELCRLAGLSQEQTAPPTAQVTLYLGKASRRGYGRAQLWIKRQEDSQPHPWRQLPLKERVTASTPLVLTLLTDAIVPDKWGRFYAGFEPAWLEKELKLKLHVKRSFCASAALDAFNAWLGLPRWRDVAVRAGSTVSLELDETLELPELQRRLEEAEYAGIGLRRNEGFGQIAFNHPLYNGCQAVQNSRIRLPSSMRLGSGAAHVLQAEERFRQTWELDLAQMDWKAFRSPEFESLARLLRSRMPASQEAVETLLAGLGSGEALLPADVVKTLAVREAEKRKLNFFAQDKGKAGLHQLRHLISNLAGKTKAGDPGWRIGLEMLADFIAAQAREGE